MTKARYVRRVVIAASLISVPARTSAQQTTAGVGLVAIQPGSDLDEYTRYLQTIGSVSSTPWNIRETSIERTSMEVPAARNPWSARFQTRTSPESLVQWSLFPVSVDTRVNSGFPFGSNDGAVWAGRGLTVAVDAGGVVRAGPVVLQLNPIVFWAQNASFPLQANGSTGRGIYRSGPPPLAAAIDLPQRFGDAAYTQLDFGESELRVETPWVMAGLSNSHRLWGPASSYPFVLGRNAAGFGHAFVSTNRPLDLWFAKISANLLYGVLSQSDYSPVAGSATYFSQLEPGRKRFASGLALSFMPRGIDGLEIGAARFVESFWPRMGIPSSYFAKPIQNFLKKSLREKNARTINDAEGSDNQLLSVFARWVLPHSGAEIYTEYGRDDHAYDFRDLVSEPDHSRTYMLGFRKVLNQDAGYLSAVRTEIINYQLPTTARHRDEGGIYAHTLLRQGHTQRGQMLGAPLGPGASAGAVVAYDRFSPDGRLTVSYTRNVNQEAGRFFITGLQSESAIDVTHTLGVERLLFRGPMDLTLGGNLSREFNRNFASDAFNFGAVARVRYNLR